MLEDLHGRPGKRKRNPLEPKPAGDLYDEPRWMTRDQRAEWRYIVENCPPGLLTSVDRANLTAYVISACLHRQAARELATAKSLVVTIGERGAQQQHPALQIVNRQALIMLKAAAEMGFTPASRSRVFETGENLPLGAGAFSGRPARGSLAAYLALKPDALPRSDN